MADANLPLPPPTPAATVVIFRHGRDGGPPELLMVQRAQEMRFAGGMAVFPGGRVDPEDRTLAGRIMAGADLEETAARIAGIRETLEETGLAIATDRQVSAAEAADARAMLLDQGALAPVLERFGWRLLPEALVPFARWCPNHARAFDTHFFLADIGTGAVDVAVDATENTRLFWASAAEALSLADRGEISMIFPTRRNLDRLALFGSYAEACAQAARYPVELIEPHEEIRDGESWLCIPEGRGYPVTAERMTRVMRGLSPSGGRLA